MTTDNIAIWAEASGMEGRTVMGDTHRPSGLPWNQHAEDLKHFRETTRGRTLIMGRRTFDSLPQIMKSRASLRDRPMIVLTSDIEALHDRTPGLPIQGLNWIETSEDAEWLLKDLAKPRSIWEELGGRGTAVIGGKRVIELFAPAVDRLVISYIRGQYPRADILAPDAAALSGFQLQHQHHLDQATTVSVFCKEPA